MNKHSASVSAGHGRTVPSPSTLSKYFPVIRTREEIFKDIRQKPDLYARFSQWDPAYQEDYLDCCAGIKGMKILYDGIFKEIFSPEYTPERLSDLLSLLFGRTVTVLGTLPNDSVRLGFESSLLYTDLLVRLEDGSLANIEIQRIGYAFPGERCACYSADHLLRQYKRVRGASGKQFHYREIKRVYTIVFFEKSPAEFHQYADCWLHKFKQRSDTGLVMELLQEYLFIPLDIFRKTMENRSISTSLEAWLGFLSFTSPERIEELITRYPRFQAMYQDIYELCLNTEKVMDMYSKELQIMDNNTALYMIDELQERLDETQERLDETSKKLLDKDQELNRVSKELTVKNQALSDKDRALNDKDQALSDKDRALSSKDQEIAALKAQIAALQQEHN